MAGGLGTRMKENLVWVRSYNFVAANGGRRFLLPMAACMVVHMARGELVSYLH